MIGGHIYIHTYIDTHIHTYIHGVFLFVDRSTYGISLTHCKCYAPTPPHPQAKMESEEKAKREGSSVAGGGGRRLGR